MNKFRNKSNCFFVFLLLAFFSCIEKESSKLNLIFDCIEPVSFSIKIQEQYLDFVDWERQEWYLKKEGIDSLYSLHLPNWGKVYNLSKFVMELVY